MTQLLDRPDDVTPAPVPTRRPAVTERAFRPDVEGLRALAVLAVVAYHAELGVRGGFVGVDVFFVISGFLITRQLLSAVGSRGAAALPSFYVRRIKRLLPASTLVVVATLLAARVWAPALQQRPIALDGIFTTFYGLNYRLAEQGTQYLHQGDAVSPLQHFWSLGIEEQFYAVWPLLIVVTAVLGRRFARPLLAVVLAGLVGVSFFYSVTVTRVLASWAYFSLHTRGWELAVGALVAIGAGRLARLPRRAADLLAALGLVGVVASAFVYSTATEYPGSAAALPVLATAAVIAAGCSGRRRVERVLGEPMLQSIGRISYSWYLWHWPMLVLTPMVVGHPLTWVGRLTVVWVSLAASIVTYFTVEERFRHGRGAPWKGLVTGVALATAVSVAAVAVIATVPKLVGTGATVTVAHADTATSAVVTGMHRAVTAGLATTNAPRNLTPALAGAATDRPVADSTNCHADFRTVTQGPCVYGDPAGTQTVVLIGDSHADVWLPAFARAGAAARWKVVDWTKSACPAASISVYNSALNRPYTECDAWHRDVVARLAALRPALVVVSNSENVAPASVSPGAWSDATLAMMRAVHARSGAKVVLMQDVPVPNYDLPGCVAAHLTTVSACNFPMAKAYSFPARHRELATAATAAGFTVVDPQPWICTASTCPAVVGNVLTYRDQTHLTAAFSDWLAPLAASLLRTA